MFISNAIFTHRMYTMITECFAATVSVQVEATGFFGLEGKLHEEETGLNVAAMTWGITLGCPARASKFGLAPEDMCHFFIRNQVVLIGWSLVIHMSLTE